MNSPSSPRTGAFTDWNRRLHYYLGLYFLFFIWLFALTGLLLNHGSWQFAEFWQNRKTSKFEREFIAPPSGSPLATAQNIMQQLGVAGEIQWVGNAPSAPRLDFRVTRPGLQYDIKAEVEKRRATVEQIKINCWGTMRALHAFTGVRINDTQNQRDWILTTLWAYSMDAVALGLIVMVLSGVLMWYRTGGNRLAGFLALGSGIVACGWFVVGLAWLMG